MIAIVGPTASGKSYIGKYLVDNYNSSVVNFDSCQIYSGLPVLKAVPDGLYEHYLYSVVSHNVRVNAFSWAQLALQSIEEIKSKNRRPVLIGGTGLYLKSFIEGLDCLPEVSLQIKEDVSKLTFCKVKEWLSNLDAKVLKVYSDERRLRKALEFVLSNGFSILDAYGKYRYNFWSGQCELFALIPQREVLLRRIHERLLFSFDIMVEEVRSFEFVCENVIGVSEIRSLLCGQISKRACIELMEIRTRRYAKRQVTFIKNSLKSSRVFDCHLDLNRFLEETFF